MRAGRRPFRHNDGELRDEVPMTQRMHADDVDPDAALVRRLLAGQFAQWADLPIERVPSPGTDNALYRIGDDLVARLPRIHWAVDKVELEQKWLPWLAPQLPFPIPAPIALGEPAEGYPHQWSVYRWLEGESAVTARIDDARQFALDLGSFIAAMQRIPLPDEPLRGGYGRGVPLAQRDAGVRAAIGKLEGMVDIPAVTAAWEAALGAPMWDGPPVWFHGDLLAGNVLLKDGRLSAVIDFGTLGTGDPAADVMAAWTLVPAEARDVFRAALPINDDSTWARARGWVLSFGLIALPYYHETNPVLADLGRRGIAEVLADPGA